MPEHSKSEYEQEYQWRKDAYAFGLAFLKYWHWWTGTTVSSGIAAFLTRGGFMIPAWVFWIVAFSGIVIASFRAFCDQRRIAEVEMDINDRECTAQKKQIALLETQVQRFQAQLEDGIKRKKLKDELAGCRITIRNLAGQLRDITFYHYVDEKRQNFEHDYLEFQNVVYGFLLDKIGRSEAETFVDSEKVQKVTIPSNVQFDLPSWKDRWIEQQFMLNRLKYLAEYLETIEEKLDSKDFVLPRDNPKHSG